MKHVTEELVWSNAQLHEIAHDPSRTERERIWALECSLARGGPVDPELLVEALLEEKLYFDGMPERAARALMDLELGPEHMRRLEQWSGWSTSSVLVTLALAVHGKPEALKFAEDETPLWFLLYLQNTGVAPEELHRACKYERAASEPEGSFGHRLWSSYLTWALAPIEELEELVARADEASGDLHEATLWRLGLGSLFLSRFVSSSRTLAPLIGLREESIPLDAVERVEKDIRGMSEEMSRQAWRDSLEEARQRWTLTDEHFAPLFEELDRLEEFIPRDEPALFWHTDVLRAVFLARGRLEYLQAHEWPEEVAEALAFTAAIPARLAAPYQARLREQVEDWEGDPSALIAQVCERGAHFREQDDPSLWRIVNRDPRRILELLEDLFGRERGLEFMATVIGAPHSIRGGYTSIHARDLVARMPEATPHIEQLLEARGRGCEELVLALGLKGTRAAETLLLEHFDVAVECGRSDLYNGLKGLEWMASAATLEPLREGWSLTQRDIFPAYSLIASLHGQLEEPQERPGLPIQLVCGACNRVFWHHIYSIWLFWDRIWDKLNLKPSYEAGRVRLSLAPLPSCPHCQSGEQCKVPALTSSILYEHVAYAQSSRNIEGVYCSPFYQPGPGDVRVRELLFVSWEERPHLMKDLERSRDYRRKEAMRQGEDPKPWFELGVAHMNLFEHEQARVALERAIELGIEDPGAWMHLSALHLRLGDPERAVELGWEALGHVSLRIVREHLQFVIKTLGEDLLLPHDPRAGLRLTLRKRVLPSQLEGRVRSRHAVVRIQDVGDWRLLGELVEYGSCTNISRAPRPKRSHRALCTFLSGQLGSLFPPFVHGRYPFDFQVPSAGAHTKVGVNDPCPCGSGRKYKKCCLRK